MKSKQSSIVGLSEVEQQEPSKSIEFVHHPHDMLFKAVFSDPEEAAAFLQEHLPADVSESLDWSTLQELSH